MKWAAGKKAVTISVKYYILIIDRSLRCTRDDWNRIDSSRIKKKRKWTILISEPLNAQRFRTSKTAPPGLLGQALWNDYMIMYVLYF